MPLNELLDPDVFADLCARLEPSEIREAAALFAKWSSPGPGRPQAPAARLQWPTILPGANTYLASLASLASSGSPLSDVELAVVQAIAMQNDPAPNVRAIAEEIFRRQYAPQLREPDTHDPPRPPRALPDAPERERKTERIYVRLTSSERADLARAAAIAGMSLTDFITQAARRAVMEVLERYYVVHLGREASETLRRLIEEPPKPSEEVLERFRTAPKAKEV